MAGGIPAALSLTTHSGGTGTCFRLGDELLSIICPVCRTLAGLYGLLFDARYQEMWLRSALSDGESVLSVCFEFWAAILVRNLNRERDFVVARFARAVPMLSPAWSMFRILLDRWLQSSPWSFAALGPW